MCGIIFLKSEKRSKGNGKLVFDQYKKQISRGSNKGYGVVYWNNNGKFKAFHYISYNLMYFFNPLASFQSIAPISPLI